jgi:hypothetical protein
MSRSKYARSEPLWIGGPAFPRQLYDCDERTRACAARRRRHLRRFDDRRTATRRVIDVTQISLHVCLRITAPAPSGSRSTSFGIGAVSSLQQPFDRSFPDARACAGRPFRD